MLYFLIDIIYQEQEENGEEVDGEHREKQHGEKQDGGAQGGEEQDGEEEDVEEQDGKIGDHNVARLFISFILNILFLKRFFYMYVKKQNK